MLSSVDKKAPPYIIDSQFSLANEYFIILATAHQCLNQTKNVPTDFEMMKKEITYGGPSPDEITLVDAAKHVGFIFMGSTQESQKLNILGKEKQNKVIASFEFDSTRKRMSILIRDENGVYKMYMKGADNIIKQRLGKNIEQPFLLKIDSYLKEFSAVGLRTLMMAMKILSEEEVIAFKEEYNLLSKS